MRKYASIWAAAAMIAGFHGAGWAAGPFTILAKDSLRFETLEAAQAQAYLDRWDARWADTRIHGTTKRQVAAMFAEERPRLLHELIGLEMADRSVARHGYAVTTPVASPTVGRESAPTAHTIGIVTSGSYGPSVGRSIAMAYVASAQAAVGTELGVEIRGQVRPARVVKTPFHPSRVKK